MKLTIRILLVLAILSIILIWRLCFFVPEYTRNIEDPSNIDLVSAFQDPFQPDNWR